MRYLTIRKLSNESGYTEAAIRSKIQDGTWIEGRVYRRAPDNRVLIDVDGYEAWVESGRKVKPDFRLEMKSHPKPVDGRRLSPAPLV